MAETRIYEMGLVSNTENNDTLVDFIVLMAQAAGSVEELEQEFAEFFGDRAREFAVWLYRVAQGKPSSLRTSKSRSSSTENVDIKSLSGLQSKKQLSTESLRRKRRNSEETGRPRELGTKKSLSKFEGSGEEEKKTKSLFTSKAKARMSGPISGYQVQSEAAVVESVAPAIPYVASKVRCKFWPACEKGETCPFVHPSEVCRFWPHCSFGSKCLNIHPQQNVSGIPCRWGVNCLRSDCFYYHPPNRVIPVARAILDPLAQDKKIPCRNDPHCDRVLCDFRHPIRDAQSASVFSVESKEGTK